MPFATILFNSTLKILWNHSQSHHTRSKSTCFSCAIHAFQWQKQRKVHGKQTKLLIQQSLLKCIIKNPTRTDKKKKCPKNKNGMSVTHLDNVVGVNKNHKRPKWSFNESMSKRPESFPDTSNLKKKKVIKPKKPIQPSLYCPTFRFFSDCSV